MLKVFSIVYGSIRVLREENWQVLMGEGLFYSIL